MPERAARLANVLRERLLWGLHAGITHLGDRFPSVRDIATRYDVDARTALRACRALATDGLLAMRRRSGMYVTVPASIDICEPGVERPITDLFVTAFAAGISPAQLPARLAASLLGRRLRVACIGGSAPEAVALCQMASSDFGVDAFPLVGDDLTASDQDALQSADASITTVFYVTRVRQALAAVERPVFVATLDAIQSEDLFTDGKPLYMVLATRQWAQRALAALDGTAAGQHLRLYVAGEDDLETIPRDVTVYVTAAAVPLIPAEFRRERHVRELQYTLNHANACGLISTIVAANGAA